MIFYLFQSLLFEKKKDEINDVVSQIIRSTEGTYPGPPDIGGSRTYFVENTQ